MTIDVRGPNERHSHAPETIQRTQIVAADDDKPIRILNVGKVIQWVAIGLAGMGGVGVTTATVSGATGANSKAVAVESRVRFAETDIKKTARDLEEHTKDYEADKARADAEKKKREELDKWFRDSVHAVCKKTRAECPPKP